VSELIIAVVPIRSFQNGKTRLASVLAPAERAALLRRSAAGVVAAALDSHVVDTLLVVSPDPETLKWAAAFGWRVMPLAQPVDRPGLNGALDFAREWAIDRDADRLLSLFADLPLLSTIDILPMVAHRQSLVLGPDRRGEGTNAMLLRLQGPGAAFRFAFGEGSLAKHLREARRLGLTAALTETPGIGFDLDTPLDWEEYVQAESQRRDRPPLLATMAGCGARCG
jgi:2-phospho-L-lactate guanylyltransferase